jgi:uncharacterized protein YjiS (DUF1127 family)
MTPARTRSRAAARPRFRLAAVLAALRLALAARRSRGALSRMPPERLEDIGITPAAARAEAARPIWDVPPHWRL